MQLQQQKVLVYQTRLREGILVERDAVHQIQDASLANNSVAGGYLLRMPLNASVRLGRADVRAANRAASKSFPCFGALVPPPCAQPLRHFGKVSRLAISYIIRQIHGASSSPVNSQLELITTPSFTKVRLRTSISR